MIVVMVRVTVKVMAKAPAASLGHAAVPVTDQPPELEMESSLSQVPEPAMEASLSRVPAMTIPGQNQSRSARKQELEHRREFGR